MTAEVMDVDTDHRDNVSNGNGDGDVIDGEEDAMEMDGGGDDMGAGKAANPAFSKFMQGFWDLASVDVPVRAGAAAMIVRHVSNPDTSGDSAYAVKRLVRGVCSSRDSARQGFASCLAEVLHVLPQDTLSTASVLEQILDVTKTTSAMKGAEERELMLGRLIGVSALALSDRLGSDAESAAATLKAVSELYGKRKWLGQAAGEACLQVISAAFQGGGEFTDVALPLIAPLLRGKDGSVLEISDLTPDQLSLALGLRSLMRARGLDPQKDAALKQALPAFLRSAKAPKAQDLTAALKQSASVFPKVHSVWGHLWDDIGLSPAGQPRASLSSKRLKRLGAVWSTVVDGTLTSTSLNNKGAAVLLLKLVLQRVPAAGVWHVMSPSMVRLMLNHTQGEDNYLFSLVKMTLQQLPALVNDDQEVQGQLAACLLRRGTVRFDSRAGVNVVGSLVKSMGQEALDKHVDFLEGVVQGKPGWGEPQDTAPNGTSPAAKSGAEKSPDGTNSAPAENAEGRMAERLQAVETLHSLGRSGDGADGQGERLSKTAEFFLETGFFAPVDEAVPLPPKVLQLCRSKFFSLVADIAAKPWLSWSPKNSNSNSGSKGDGEGGAKWEALEAMWGLHEAWQGLEAGGRKPATGVKVGADEREACAVALAVVGRIREGEGSKLAYAFAGFLMMVALHLLDGSSGEDRGEERCQHVLDIVETYGRMSATKGKGGGDATDDNQDDDDGDGEDVDDPDPLAMLADVLVAVVAEPSSHSVRGLRDTARRVWSIVCHTLPLTKSALDTLLATVCGEDSDTSPGDGEDESSSEEEEDDDDDDEEEEDDMEGAEGKDDGAGEGANSDEDNMDDDQDEDEVMVDPSDLAALLGGKGSDGDSDDDGDGLQHHAGADKALAGLIGLKKSGRKKGAQEAQRQAYQIRLRALDFLEVLCGRSLQSPHLIGALLPVLKAIKKLGGSSGLGIRNGGEASALRQRLETLYKRLCKCKPHVAAEKSSSESGDTSDDPPPQTGEAFPDLITLSRAAAGESPTESGDASNDFPTQIAKAFSELLTLCRSWQKSPDLASLAIEGALCCLRSLKGRPGANENAGEGKGKKNAVVKGGNRNVALDGALAELATAVGEFFRKKRGGGFTAAQVEEVVKRFPEEMVPVLVSAAMGSAASDFLRTEAFRLVGNILQRRGQQSPVSRKTLLTNCPKILKALCNVLTATAASASAATASSERASLSCEHAKDTSTNDKKGDTDAKDSAGETSKTCPNPAAASLSMLKTKRLKSLLACLSVSIKAIAEASAEKDSDSLLPALSAEATALRGALSAMGEASTSLPMQRLCESVAGELDILGGGDGDVQVELSQTPVDDLEVIRDGEKSAKKKKKVKKRRESDAAAEEVGRGDAEDGSLKKKKSKKKRGGAEGSGGGIVDSPKGGEEVKAETSPMDGGKRSKGESKSERKLKGGGAKRRKTLEG